MSDGVSATVNGKPVSMAGAGTRRLSELLRHDLDLKGTKVGCDAGDCGACTVLIDGETACACLVAGGQVDGHAVTTVEGLRANGSLSALQESFLRHGAAQCGICTPGMLVSARALLDRNSRPSRVEVQDALGGVLCRCTGYAKIVDAVMDVIDAPATANLRGGVGEPIRHVDGVPKVTGETIYGADCVPADAVWVRVIRSPHHRAGFKIGDKQGFVAGHPGLIAVFDARDVPGRNRHGTIAPFADQPVFAEKIARFKGEAVAAVAGEREAIMALDVRDFPVEWQALDHCLTPDEALGQGAPVLHETRPDNVLVRGLVRRGDPDAAIASAAHAVSARFSTPFIEHGYIEPEAGFARRAGDRIEIHGCTQTAHMNRDDMIGIMGLDPDNVRIVPSACGGGFGSKLDISWQPYVAIAAWVLGRPAAIIYTRGESMQSTTKRHPSEIELSVGCDVDGRVTGMAFSGTFNTGAYASWGPTVANRVPVHASGPYHVENYRAESVAVHTNCAPSGAFRGFGVPQSAIAQESLFDELADKAGIDRLEFRLLNALDDGLPTVTGQVFETGVGIKPCLEALRPRWREALEAAIAFNRTAEESGSSLRRGAGIGTCWYGCGNTSLPNPSTMRIGVKADGTLVLHQGAIDIGQGSNTVMSQILAETLGVAAEAIMLVGADTDVTPDAGKTSASRQTFVSGRATLKSALALKAQILRHANVSDKAQLTFEPGRITVGDDMATARIELADLPANEFGYVFMSEETYDPPTKPMDENGQGDPYALYGYGAQMVELTVDTRLGTVKLDRITAAHDVGQAINPMLVEGQIEGGIAQGIGLALMEEFLPGRTENLHDYLIPTFGDVPPIDSIVVEVPDGEGPYGAKGLGEHVLIPTAPAILNAIRAATGARLRHLPATPDRVLSAIREVDGHE
ncbi:MAG: molybdopterin cofactor-binding domain-containing protein [Rhizobiaceae bacterium]